ncbi:short chain dehydrogenase [Xylaria palmicola]|nr:short chain dehydrogenase [Xylaria palmicola]
MDLSNLFRVDGMVAVVTGGGTGIGFMMAKALSGAGAKVYILGRRVSTLEAAASSHPNIVPLVCDVTSKASLQGAVDRITAEAGYVNLVVANAGIFGPPASYDSSLSVRALRRALFEGVDMAAFTETMHVNATAAYFTLLAFLELLDSGNQNALRGEGGFGGPSLREEGGGGGGRSTGVPPFVQSQVVFTASVGSFSRERATPPAYAASKSAVAHLAKHAATNLAPYQIRVNTLAPGFFMSEMAAPVMGARDPGSEGPDHPDFMPARRFGAEEEVAGSILYLASRAGAYCNGMCLSFDGGRLAVIPSTY